MTFSAVNECGFDGSLRADRTNIHHYVRVTLISWCGLENKSTGIIITYSCCWDINLLYSPAVFGTN